MTLPNFLVIGAAKSGTTSLHAYLQQHPQIFVPRNKEPSFFAYEGETLAFGGDVDPIFVSRIPTTFEAYQSLFHKAEGKRAVGESSTVYMYSPKACERIRHYLPRVKLIAMLRNPAERAYSCYLMNVRDGRETLDFCRALEREAQRIRENWTHNWHYLTGGVYYQQLKRYYERFAPSQIRIFLYEDFEREPLRVLKEIFQFLGVDETFMPNISFRFNVSTGNRSLGYRVQRRLFRTRPLRAVHPYLPRGLQKYIERRLLMQDYPKPTLEPEIRARLLRVYREDITQLQDLIQRDLSHWLD